MSTSNSGTSQVSLFVPELLSGIRFLKDIPKQEIPKLPALQLLLSRAKQHQNGFDDFYDGICTLTGLSKKNQQELPIAAITVAADSISKNKTHTKDNSEYYIFAEPVIMNADRDSLVLIDSLVSDSVNKLLRSESELLVTEINSHFIDEPWTLHLTTQGAWYLTLNSKTNIKTSNISSVFFKNTQEFIPTGEDARYWRQIVTEIEMLLFASKVNETRVENNLASVCGVWLWGGGKMPSIPSMDSDKNDRVNGMILGSDIFLHSVATLFNMPCKSINTKNVNEMLAANNSNNMIVNNELKTFWQQRDLFSWINTLKKMENEIFEPLIKSLRKGNIESITLYQEQQEVFQISSRDAKRWWQPIKSLETLSSTL